MNKWATFQLAIHAIPQGGIFRRKGLIAQLSMTLTEEQIDNYRLHVERAGFIARLSCGRYQKLKQIPLSLGWRECMRMAYPDRQPWCRKDIGEEVAHLPDEE